jgi:Rrf2 family protein
MKLSAKSRCGARILIDLAYYHNQGPEQVGNISKRQNISVKYLEQLIRPLKKAQLVKSVRGPKGGHVLEKKPEDITLGQVVRLLEGRDGLDECYCNEEKCSLTDTCRLRLSWHQAVNEFYKKLDQTTIADLIGECCT